MVLRVDASSHVSAPLVVVLLTGVSPALSMYLPYSGSLVANNTFVRNPMGIRFLRYTDVTQQVYRNNIIVDNTVGVVFGDGVTVGSPAATSGQAVWQHNLIFGNDVNYQGMADPTGTHHRSR